MKYFFEAGMGKRQSKPGVRPRANFGSDEDAGGEINGIRMS